MPSRWNLPFGALLFSLALAPAAQAQYRCDQIACHVPPIASCSEPCLDCQRGGGTEYQDDTCRNPTVITVGECGCPCLTSTMPDFFKDLRPGAAPSQPVAPEKPAIDPAKPVPPTAGLQVRQPRQP